MPGARNPPLTDYRLPPNRLDFVRFVLASLVIVSHSYPLATGTEDAEPLAVFTGKQLTLGTVAVNCFFIISGFLILHSWLTRPELVSYLGKRIRRIYPGFIATTLLCALVVWPLTTRSGYAGISPGFVLELLLNVLRLQSLTPGPSFIDNPAPGVMNGSLWSIPFEFWCYVGILVLGLAKLAHRPRLIAALFVFFLAVSFVFVWKHLTPGGRMLGAIFGYPPFWARLLPYFLAGMTLYHYRDAIKFNTLGAALCLIGLVIAAKVPNGMVFALPVAAAYLMFWFAFLPGNWLKGFGKYGDFSYGIYLYSFPITQLVVWAHGQPIEPWALFLIAWPLSIVCGVLSWRLLESRFVARKKIDNRNTPASSGGLPQPASPH